MTKDQYAESISHREVPVAEAVDDGKTYMPPDYVRTKDIEVKNID